LKILVLGITGMLGSAVFKALCESKRHQVWGSQRGRSPHPKLAEFPSAGILTGLDVLDQDSLTHTFAKVKPNVVINCVGLIKQLDQANDPLVALPINSLLPHRLLQLCEVAGARLVHISTDCVFSGRKGNYLETDVSDAEDLYGKSKYIGELHNSPYAITLRTSIIGHELGTSFALLEWFLAQQGTVKGFSKAIFSGVPTCELAEIILDHVIPTPERYMACPVLQPSPSPNSICFSWLPKPMAYAPRSTPTAAWSSTVHCVQTASSRQAGILPLNGLI